MGNGAIASHETPPHEPGNERANWWRCLFESAEDPQFVCDSNGIVRECNPRAARLLARVRQPDWNGVLLPEILTPAAERKALELLKRRVGAPENILSVTVRLDGKLSWIADIQVTPLSPGFSLLTIKDASRRWRMESHLQRLVAAIDATTDVFFLTNAEFKLIFVNSAFTQVTGFTVEEVLGRDADFLRASSEAEKIAAYNKRVREGFDWSGELNNIRSDGSIYPVESIISPIHDKDGQLMGFVACERDVSAKKKLQDEVLIERDFARSIIDSLDSAIYTIDRSFRITHINEAWRKLPAQHGWLNMQPAPEIGRCLLDYITDPGKRTHLEEAFGQVLSNRQSQELRGSGPSGLRWLVKISPWQHGGDVIGLIYHVSDETKYHELQKQLYQAQKMETIGALAAGVAHDFNNLLQVIRGNLSLALLEEGLGDQLLSRLQHIDEAAERAAEITTQLLSFTRASEERISVLDFNQVIHESTHLVRRSFKANINMSVIPSEQLLKVKMDATRAQQLLLNLCVNAADAMPGGGDLTITNIPWTVTAAQAERHQRRVGEPALRCTVRDTGSGIPPEVLPRIFDPFFTTKMPGKGTGLGLSIVHNVVRQAGGFLEVETEKGKGTAFHIYLPTVDAAVTATEKAPLRKMVRSSGRILVVEDQDLVRDFTQSFLREAGFDVLVAADGNEALELLQMEEVKVDLILTDFNMPGINGVELIEQVKALYPSIKCVVASGYLDEAEVLRVQECGAKTLNKPYNMREAIDLVVSAIHG